MLAIFVASVTSNLIIKNKSFWAARLNELESYSEGRACSKFRLCELTVGYIEQVRGHFSCLNIAQCFVEIFMEKSFKETFEEF